MCKLLGVTRSLVYYKRKNNIPFTKAEKYFFNGKDFRHIINLLKNKRL